jgi:hypothetical protein
VLTEGNLGSASDKVDFGKLCRRNFRNIPPKMERIYQVMLRVMINNHSLGW